MSTNVSSYGIMAPILSETPEWEELQDMLGEDGSRLQINYDQTLAYIDLGGKGEDEIQFSGGVSAEELAVAAIPYNIRIAMDRACSFNCTWYNGGDSPLDLITLEQFYRRTEGL